MKKTGNRTKEFEILDKHLAQKGFKSTQQREEILEIFLKEERHLSAEDLYELVKKKTSATGGRARIGISTVYRSLKLFCECGLARETHLGDGRVRFEHHYAHPHHDHLICTKCGTAIEFFSEKMEQLQDKIADEHSFIPQRHRMEVYGLCKNCQ